MMMQLVVIIIYCLFLASTQHCLTVYLALGHQNVGLEINRIGGIWDRAIDYLPPGQQSSHCT